MTAQAETLRHDTLWTCDKWDEEAVDFARDKLERVGITHIPGHMIYVPVVKKQSQLDRLLRRHQESRLVRTPALVPIRHGISSSILKSLVGEPEETTEIVGNLLLNEGIQRLQDLTMIATPTTNQTATNAWGNTNAFLGVGTSATAEAATQTDLSGTSDSSNRAYKAMNATYPSRSNQTVSFQSDFISTEGNFIWNEWSVAASTTTAGGGGSFLNGTVNLNRKVASLGTKSTGTWTLTGQITFS